jgi:peptide/nickel transport system substrate-binding protein
MRDQARAGRAAISHQTWGTLVNDVSAMTPVFFKLTPDDVNRDTEISDLLEQGDSSVDPAPRNQAYGKALALVEERAYALPLFSLPTYYVTAEGLVFEAPSDEMPRFWEMRWR